MSESKEYNIDNDIAFLSQHEQFARFMQTIEIAREGVMVDMSGATTENIQQLSGRLVQCNDILAMVNYEKLRRQHLQRMLE